MTTPTTTTAHQTVAAGRTPLSKYAGLGVVAKGIRYPFDRVFGMVVGEQSAGKSYLFLSNPNAFVINLDFSGVVHPRSEACIWPALNEKGDLCDSDGSLITDFTWEMVEAKRQLLIKLAKEGQPRPDVVVLDTVTAAVRLLKSYAARHFGKMSFEEAHGPAAWDKAYDTLIEFGLSLRGAGYGVWFIAHTTRKWHSVDEKSEIEKIELALSEGLANRLCRTVEFIAPLKCDRSLKGVQKEQVIPLPGGKSTTRTVTVTETVFKRYLAFEDPQYLHLLRVRTVKPMKTVEFDDQDPWSKFRSAYKAANNEEAT